ncbi:hypothetical protein [Brevundimonas sp.]|uniref:hypothetical protein n=1 Tax=Brevundimonas sp. TaxID=1871086 RepID=UPI0028AAFBC7|nr:hypothetical protein [Brevundimonas sp.]
MSDVAAFAQRFDDAVEGRLEGMPSVTFADRSVYPRPFVDAVDAFSAALGYQPLGDAWHVLSSEELATELTQQLRVSLAYRVETMPEDQAASISRQFIDLFDPESVRFLTNFRNNGWNPITTSTMEAAYVGIDGDLIGLLLFQDED